MGKDKAKAAVKGRGLGKGLSALMSESYSQVEVEVIEDTIAEQEEQQAEQANISTLVSTKTMLPLSSLRPGPFQPRRNFDSAALQELADSIRKNGVMQPVLVRPVKDGKYEIIAGERRWRASQMAGLSDIPVLVREMDDEVALELALVENIQRKDLTPLEEAAGYQRLMDEFGYTQELLAASVHKSRSHIANLLRLLLLPDDVRQMLEEDKISMGHARALMGTPNPMSLAQDVVRKGLNVRQTEKIAYSQKNSGAEGKPRKPRASKADAAQVRPVQQQQVYVPAKDPDILALEETLSENLGLKVGITDRGQSGEIVISYESLDQLDDILRRLGGSI